MKTTHRSLLASTFVGLAALFALASAANAAAPAGHWEGAIELPNTKLEIRVDFAPEGYAGGGTIDIPVQNIRGFALGDVVVDGRDVSFRMPDIPGDPTFKGVISDDSRINGTFTQGGQTFPFALERRASTARPGETPSHGIPGESLAGHWQGSLRQGPAELRLVLHVQGETEDNYKATVDSLDQGAKGIPVSKVQFADGVVRIELARIQAVYEGKLSDDGSEIDGHWKQGPVDAPIVFRRLAAAPELARPQMPQKPYPYAEREITFAGGAADVTLAGTLTMPDGDGPFPAVVLLSGSGPQDRDEALMGHRPFLVLADHLTRQGIAVLRFDDRGVAKSQGNYREATHEDFAADARAAFNFLKAQPDVDLAHVGLCGHSEGGVHAPLVAAEHDDVAFIVMLAGVGVPLAELLPRQQDDLMKVMGVPEDIRQEQRQAQHDVFAILRELGGTAEARHKIRTRLLEVVAKYTPEQLKAMGYSEGVIDQQIGMMTSPWFVKLLRYDPAPTLARVHCPVLALNGTKDTQVACQENLAGIRAGLAAGGNTDVTTVALPGLNHLFQHCQTGAISEYGAIEETMSPEVLTLVSDWILRHTDS